LSRLSVVVPLDIGPENKKLLVKTLARSLS